MPIVSGRLTEIPLPVPNPSPNSRRSAPFSNFCPDILDHLPKCVRTVTSTCGCDIPNSGKAVTFWNSLDNDQDNMATLAELEELRARFANPITSLAEDKNPVGANLLAGAFDLLNQIFATTQAARDGTMNFGLTRQQFMDLNVQRRFPSKYSFPGGCFVDPNENINQNDYSTPGAMQAAGWTIIGADSASELCKDTQNGLSQLTGGVFYGFSAKVTVRGSGIGYVDFGNCADAGVTTLKIGGVAVSRADPGLVSKVSTFSYSDGQILEVIAGNGAVARMNFVAFNGTLVSKSGEPCPPHAK